MAVKGDGKIGYSVGDDNQLRAWNATGDAGGNINDVATLPDFYRRLWAVGPAGTGVPLTAIRGGTRLHLVVRSVDRVDLLKRPQAH